MALCVKVVSVFGVVSFWVSAKNLDPVLWRYRDFLLHYGDFVLPTGASGRGKVPLHAQSVCCSHSSVYKTLAWPVIGEE